jgi:hypothetical protein
MENGEVFAPALVRMTGLRSLRLDLEACCFQAIGKFQLDRVLAALINT